MLRGREVGRGPDCEPLLADVQPVASRIAFARYYRQARQIGVVRSPSSAMQVALRLCADWRSGVVD
jgi:hypothetical protein